MPWLHIRLAVCVCLLVTMSGQGARAQDATWLRVDIVQVIPEQLDDYLELQLDDVNPAFRRAGVPWRSAWQTAEFGNTYERWFATPIGSMADYDGGGPLGRVLEPDRLDSLRDRVRECLVSSETFAVRYRQDLSVESEDVSGLYLARMTTIEIAPGRTAEWVAFLRENLPEFRAAGVVFGVYERVYGPGPTSWQIVENHASFDDLNQPGIIARAFGDEAGGVVARIAGVVTSIERSVLRYDPVLSFTTAPANAQP